MKSSKRKKIYAFTCPFCGAGSGGVGEMWNYSGEPCEYIMHCYGCGAQGPHGDTRKDAIAKWNGRAK